VPKFKNISMKEYKQFYVKSHEFKELKKQNSELTINTREDLIIEYEHLTGGDAYAPSGEPKAAYTFWLEDKMIEMIK